MDGSRLRGIPVVSALKISGLDFAAGQCHSLENPLMPECRLLIGLFRRAAALDCVLLVCVPVLFSHKKRFPAALTAESTNRQGTTTNHFFAVAYDKKRVWSSITVGSVTVGSFIVGTSHKIGS
jgi:hypothetical protein